MKSWTLVDELNEMVKQQEQQDAGKKELENMLEILFGEDVESKTVSRMIEEEIERRAKETKLQVAKIAKERVVRELRETMAGINDDFTIAKVGGVIFFEVLDLYNQCAETLAEITNMTVEEFLDYEVEEDSYLEFILV